MFLKFTVNTKHQVSDTKSLTAICHTVLSNSGLVLPQSANTVTHKMGSKAFPVSNRLLF